MRGISRAPLITVLWLASACSGSGGSRNLHVGHESDGKDGGSAGAFGAAADAAADGGVANGGEALNVHVEDVDAMTIEVITLACAGDCADVQAVARGGNAPYAFAWDDGSASATRHVCLDASSTLHVEVTDTAIMDKEFRYDAHTATTTVTANVLDCSDSGQATCDTPASVPPDGVYKGPYNSDVLAGLSGGTASFTCTKGAGTHFQAMLNADLIGVLHATVDLEGDVDCVSGELVLRGVETGNGADGRLWVVTLKYDSTSGDIAADYAALCVPGAAVCSNTKVVPAPPAPHQKVAACGPGVEPCGDSGTFTVSPSP